MSKIKKILESKKSDELVKAINMDIDKIDDSLSIKDFAMAVAKILEEQYGSHNYSEFDNIIKQHR